jgi:hypothetical protein
MSIKGFDPTGYDSGKQYERTENIVETVCASGSYLLIKRVKMGHDINQLEFARNFTETTEGMANYFIEVAHSYKCDLFLWNEGKPTNHE